MKVKDLIKQLQELPQDDEIVIIGMDNRFFCYDFEVHSAYGNGKAQKIVLPYYLNDYEKEEEN